MTERRAGTFDIFRLLLVLLPCIFFLPVLLGVWQFAGWDVTRLNLPLKWYDVQSIRDGVLPLWNHYLYAGMPQLAESESGLFYPGNILLHLPGNFFYYAGLTYILHFIMAGLFMDLWLRGRGVKPLFSFMGGVLFQTAPFLLFHITSMALLQSVVWFPLLLWLADRFLLEPYPGRRRLYAGFLMLTGGLLLTIGSGQMAFYQGLLLFFYLLGHVFSSKQGFKRTSISSVWILLSLIVGAMILGAVIWMPTGEFTATTVREMSDKAFYKTGSNWLHPLRLVSAFYFPAFGKQTEVVGWASSIFYIGLLPTILAILRLLGIKTNWHKDAPLIMMGGMALLLAFGMLNPLNHLLIEIPPFSMFRYQGRIALGVLVALIALAGHYLSNVPGDDEVKVEVDQDLIRKRIVVSIGIIFILLVGFLFIANRSTAVLIGGGVFIVDLALAWWGIKWVMKRDNKRVPAWMATYLIFHLIVVWPVGWLFTMNSGKFNNAMKFMDHVQRIDGQPARMLAVDIGRFAERDLLEMTPLNGFPNLCGGNTGVFREIQIMDAYTPLRPVEWDRLVGNEIWKGFQESGTILGYETGAKLESIGIDYVITSGDVITIPGYSEMTDVDLSISWGEGTRFYRIDDPQPRVWALNLNETGKDEVGILELSRNGARAEIDTTADAVIVEISYDKNWVVTVDGDPVEVNPYYGIFCEVNTGPGEHMIEFDYFPASLKKGSAISFIGLILVLAWIVSSIFRKPEQSPLP